MAHLLDTRENGAASFVSLRKPAWHQLGTIVGDELSYDEAMNLGGLDYPLSLRPLTTTSPIRGSDGVESDSLEVSVPGRFAVVREDRREVLGVVGSRYRIVSNRDATAVVEALVDAGMARIETAGVLRGGVDAWMALRFVGSQFESASDIGGDEVRFYGMVRTNHDGTANVQVATTPIRVVCANTLAMALSNGESAIHKIRHTRSAEQRIAAEAQSLWSTIGGDAVRMAEAFRSMRQRRISETMFSSAVLDALAPLPKAPPAGASSRARTMYETAMETAKNQRLIVTRLWTNGMGHTGDYSAWEAYNAATEAIDHYGVGAPTRGAAASESLIGQLPGGTLAATKTTVFQRLLALAA